MCYVDCRDPISEKIPSVRGSEEGEESTTLPPALEGLQALKAHICFCFNVHELFPQQKELLPHMLQAVNTQSDHPALTSNATSF